MILEAKLSKYELWSSASENTDVFFSADNYSARQTLAVDARLVTVIEATSWNEAQQERYDFMGWGHYRTVEEDAAEETIAETPQ